MNQISSRTESKTETQVTETDDGQGNIVQTETTVTRTYLYITVSYKTVDEMAAQYGFNQEQKYCLTELLKDENNSVWSACFTVSHTAAIRLWLLHSLRFAMSAVCRSIKNSRLYFLQAA